MHDLISILGQFLIGAVSFFLVVILIASAIAWALGMTITIPVKSLLVISVIVGLIMVPNLDPW